MRLPFAIPSVIVTVALIAACASSPTPSTNVGVWSTDVEPTLTAAHHGGADTAVFFELPGREMSDRMAQRALHHPAVLRALDVGAFRSIQVDGFDRADLYTRWIGGGEGMGIAILDPQQRCYAARPGAQDPGELAAFLAAAARQRNAIAGVRAQLNASPDDSTTQHQLAVMMLELGCRVEAEQLLRKAAAGGVIDSRHRLARLFALDGALLEAQEWLQGAPITPAARVTAGYVLYKQRRHLDAARVFTEAIQLGDLGPDRQRALLYLGKALHLQKRSHEAEQIFLDLIAEGTGSTYEAAAEHSLQHIYDPNDHSHTH